MVEYQNTAIGQDTVKVYKRNAVGCDVPEGTVCCGMPWLDAGNIGAFTSQAERNVRILAQHVRDGKDIVVLQPTCGYVLKQEYPTYVGGEEAETVGAHSCDVAEYLMKIHREEGKSLDLEFPGTVPETGACHVRVPSARRTWAIAAAT